jgi:hypothetical protein
LIYEIPTTPVVPKNRIRTDSRDEAESAHPPMRCLRSSIVGMFVVNRFRSRRRLEVENLFLVISSILPLI